jgi:hypothetical protein
MHRSTADRPSAGYNSSIAMFGLSAMREPGINQQLQALQLKAPHTIGFGAALFGGLISIFGEADRKDPRGQKTLVAIRGSLKL